MPPSAMASILSGPINHLGFSVPSLAEAANWWASTYSAGPFLSIRDVSFDVLEGADADEQVTWKHSAAFGQWGQVGLELQETVSAAPPRLADQLGVGRPGLNHISYVVDDPVATGERLEAAGMPRILHAAVFGVDFYLHRVPDASYAIELHRDGENTVMFEELRELAHDWDGREPLRPLSVAH